jgi:AcrR family transcriptional regulator
MLPHMPRNLSSAEVEAFRARLCRAAERRFAAAGVEGVSLRALAAELGCSPMTPYRYFRDKDEILAAVRAAAFARFAAALEAAGRTRGSAVERARAVGEAYLRFALDEPDAYRLMFDLSQPEEERYPELTAAAARARRTMTDYVEALVAEGAVEGDPVLLGYVFWATVHGIVVLHLAGKLPAAPDFRTIHRAALHLLTAGARPSARRRHSPARRRRA